MSGAPAPSPNPNPNPNPAPVKPKPRPSGLSSGFTPGIIKNGQPMSLASQILKKAGGIF